MAAGAKSALMSGSGSSMFAPFETAMQGRDVAERIKGDFAYCDVVSAVNKGVEIEHQETIK